MNGPRLGHVADLYAGQSPPSEEVLSGTGSHMPFVQGNAEFGQRHPSPTKQCPTARRVAAPGDILISVRAPVGALNVADQSIGIGRGLCAVRPRSADPDFVWWFLHSAVDSLRAVSTGSTYEAISTDDLAAVRLPPWSIERQQRIARFLNAETGRIDQLVDAKAVTLELLNARIDSQVMSLVGRSPLTGGSEIPATPIKRQVNRLERWATGGEMVTAFRDGQVTSRVARGREGFTDSWTEEARVQKVREGEVVVHGLDGFSGAIGDSEAEGVCSPANHVCTAIDGDNAFFARMLRLLARSGYLGNFATSTRERAVDFRNWDLFGAIPVPLVPSVQQRRIGDEIRAVRPLQRLVSLTQSLAEERRRALIALAVTGEMEVA